jgi:site-specific recombinase XerD
VAIATARKLHDASRADNTRRAYAFDWKGFSEWCAKHGFSALPATERTIVLYLSHLFAMGRKRATIQRHRTAISVEHELAGLPNPTKSTSVREAWAGLTREIAKTPRAVRTQKTPAVAGLVRQWVDAIPGNGLAALRNRALLLLAFAGAFRRSEVVSIHLEQLEHHPEGLAIRFAHSKTGPFIRQIVRQSNPSLCPVESLEEWLKLSNITSGLVFRRFRADGSLSVKGLSAAYVARLVKECARASGLDPRKFAGHSLRRGIVTTSAERGHSLWSILQQTGHRDERQVKPYIDLAENWRTNVTRGLFDE